MLNILIVVVEQFFLYLPLVIGAFVSFSLLKIPNLCLEAAFLVGAIGSHLVLEAIPALPLVIKLLMGTVVGFAGGALVGFVCGLIITRGLIAHLLANIVTVGLFSGISLFLIGGSFTAIGQHESGLTLIPCAQHPEFFMSSIIAILCGACMVYLLTTPLGKSIVVYGNNPSFFEQHRMSTSSVLMAGIILSNAFAGVSGFLISQTNGFIDINSSAGLVLLCLTALVFGKKTRGILQPFVGLLLFCIAQQILLIIGLNLAYFTSISSLLLLSVMILARDKTVRSVPTDQLGV
ncbi:MAG: ABC transporter, permease [candidate division TM6 bacterium GW2011_GWE2_42_60]|nr:MAG: ABC transporter, permease [candidate division TM6 bacterium GW2011_GWE2_42_60]HBY05778.1 hypothetical protein [Candidatus Dependentiae bacterium]